MNYKSQSIRAFIGAKNYNESRTFYKELGFEVVDIPGKMCRVIVHDNYSFYLQDYYVKDWVNNSMIFLEVDDLDNCWVDVNDRRLQDKYKYVRLSEIKTLEWGREFFLHDPSGVLWHFGEFNDVARHDDAT